MGQPTTTGIEPLIERLDEAVGAVRADVVAGRVKAVLEAAVGEGLRLPERFLAPRRECYARRLLHRDPARGYSVVVMTWGPGQRTRLHDHAGVWCVECVVQGRMEVTQFDLIEERRGRLRFLERRAVPAGVGEAGCLIPPYEYHVLANALPDRTSLTLHVYGGDMARCNLYHPVGEQWWERQTKELSFDP